MVEEDSGDELCQLIQRGFFVQYATRPINLDTIPLDGNEFIHKSRLAEADISFAPNKVSVVTSCEKNSKDWSRMSAVEFGRYALKLTTDKFSLKKKFPRKLAFPKNGPSCAQAWCIFCLGSKLCSEIYSESKYQKEVLGHEPFLSIVIHFDQYTAVIVLQHLHEWFLILGMEDSIAKWTYAVLACLKKPLDDYCKELLKTFYNNCQKRLKCSDELERCRLLLISSIFVYYFCINSDKVGSSLETFLNMAS